MVAATVVPGNHRDIGVPGVYTFTLLNSIEARRGLLEVCEAVGVAWSARAVGVWVAGHMHKIRKRRGGYDSQAVLC